MRRPPDPPAGDADDADDAWRDDESGADAGDDAWARVSADRAAVRAGASGGGRHRGHDAEWEAGWGEAAARRRGADPGDGARDDEAEGRAAGGGGGGHDDDGHEYDGDDGNDGDGGNGRRRRGDREPPPPLLRFARFLRRLGRREEGPRYLVPGETEVCRARKHWVVLVRPALWLLGSIVVAGLLGGQDLTLDRFVSLLMLVAVVNLLGRVLAWWDFQYVLTDKRVMSVATLPLPAVASMSLRKVTDLTYRQTLFGVLARYGSFVIESAGQNQALSRLEPVSKSGVFYDRLIRQAFVGKFPGY